MTGTRPRLKALREERGWTQQDVAEQISRLAWLREHEHVGVNADMVAKWERGDKQPSSRYRELLCLVFETDAHGLGLGGPAPACRARRARRGGPQLADGDARRRGVGVRPARRRRGRSCSRGLRTCGRTRSCSVVPC